MKEAQQFGQAVYSYSIVFCYLQKWMRPARVMVIVLALMMYACADDEGRPAFQPEFIVEYETIRTYSRDEILSIMDMETPGLFDLTNLIRYDVKAIRVNYLTVNEDQQSILASGALMLPVANGYFPVLSFQHGTLDNASEAPSLMNSIYSDLGAFFASAGFIGILPDYLGYGASSSMEHPYQHRQTLATATRDMIRASYEYFKLEDQPRPNGNLFLSGYSQGGYATLAALKLMQEQHADEFRIKAATAGGGPYNKTATVKHFLSANAPFEGINTYMWVLDTYNRIYPSLQRPYSDYYNPPWDLVIEENGVFTDVEMNPTLLFTESFRARVLSGTDLAIMQVLADNDLYAWKPEVPLQIYHGTDDALVPFLNASTTYDAMRMMGAQHVELKTVEGGTHLSAFYDYLIGTFVFFLSMSFS